MHIRHIDKGLGLYILFVIFKTQSPAPGRASADSDSPAPGRRGVTQPLTGTVWQAPGRRPAAAGGFKLQAPETRRNSKRTVTSRHTGDSDTP